MYADKITDSMRQTIEETERRRSIQLAYNEEHGITPQAIVKARQAIIGIDDAEPQPEQKGKRGAASKKGRSQTKSETPMPYIQEYSHKVNIAADPVVPYMNREEMQRSIARLRTEMVAAAKNMDFMEAARMRDEILQMEAHLEKLSE
jgi:excinuclease ABC subunit B